MSNYIESLIIAIKTCKRKEALTATEEALATGIPPKEILQALMAGMDAMQTTVKEIPSQGLSVKVMVGGAPINQGFADDIVAHGYAPDAASAVDLARRLCA